MNAGRAARAPKTSLDASMLWIKAFHIIFIVTWFSALFYLPRLFVYHANTHDIEGNARFKIMERKLYYGIAWPSAVLTTVLGVWLLSYNFQGYLSARWMQIKLLLVIVLWLFQFSCGYYRKRFYYDQNQRSHRFFRYYNEFPTLILIVVVILVVVKP